MRPKMFLVPTFTNKKKPKQSRDFFPAFDSRPLFRFSGAAMQVCKSLPLQNALSLSPQV